MIRKSLATIMFGTFILLAGCQEETNNGAAESETEIGTPEEQIANIQDDFNEMIAETETEYGKLVFYSLDNDENATGVGLAVFNEEDGTWVYSKGTTNLISNSSETEAFSSDRIEINDETKVVYGYRHESPNSEIQEVDSEELVDNTLVLEESVISYTFVSPDETVTISRNN
ncbi:hypothetical protein DHX103_00485 [Planococcus sp. X10-3]|uniref:hypothetical protein n=1 Tax=Planococcus sp. X10-3 TaxID=3061240 RepID=UPI003BB0FA0E